MPVCDSPHHRQPWKTGWLWVVLVFWPALLAPCASVFGGEPGEMAETDSLWSVDFPKVERRISWGWPKFLSPHWPGSRLEEEPPAIEVMPCTSSLGKPFGALDWLSYRRDAAPTLLSAKPPTLQTGRDGLNSSWFPDFLSPFDDPPATDYDVILVRGGSPTLFGSTGRIRGEIGDKFSDARRIRGQLVLSLVANRVGIDTSVNSWHDKRPAPRGLGNFWTGDFNVVYSMGSQYMAMRGGGGTAWVHNKNLDLGYNVTYGADLFLSRPFLVSAEVDWGKINQQKLFHWRGTVGVQLWMFELYVGYDSYRWDYIHFSGPVAGAGMWF